MTSKNFTQPDPNIHRNDCPGGMPVAYAFFCDCTVRALFEQKELLGIRPCEMVFPRGIPRDWLFALMQIELYGKARIYTGSTLHQPGTSYNDNSAPSDASEPSDDPLTKLKRNMLDQLKTLRAELGGRCQLECVKQGITSPEIESIRHKIETLKLIGNLLP